MTVPGPEAAPVPAGEPEPGSAPAPVQDVPSGPEPDLPEPDVPKPDVPEPDVAPAAAPTAPVEPDPGPASGLVGAVSPESEQGEAEGAPTYPTDVWHIVAVAGVVMDLPNAIPEVILHEAQDPWRELRIPVGLAEGTAIAYVFRSVHTPRPLTHELVTEIFDRHDVRVEAVRITVRRGQAYFAEVDTTSPRGRHVVPCRPSDAIALALRQRMPTPILVADWVFTGADAPPGVGEGAGPTTP